MKGMLYEVRCLKSNEDMILAQVRGSYLHLSNFDNTIFCFPVFFIAICVVQAQFAHIPRVEIFSPCAYRIRFPYNCLEWIVW